MPLCSPEDSETSTCTRYWPDTVSQTFGSVTVTKLAEETTPFYVMRTLGIRLLKGPVVRVTTGRTNTVYLAQNSAADVHLRMALTRWTLHGAIQAFDNSKGCSVG